MKEMVVKGKRAVEEKPALASSPIVDPLDRPSNKDIKKSTSELSSTSTVVSHDAPAKKKSHTGFKIFSCLTLILIIAFVSLVGGALAYVKFEPWLMEHGFLGDNTSIPATQTVTNQENRVLKVTSEENVVISVVEQTMDSVVTIAVSQVDFSVENGGVVNRIDNIGTGFIVDPQGYILTNQHVVSDPAITYEAILNDGTSHEITSIARDDVNDIAILKIDAKDLTAVNLGDSEALVVGQMVIAIGTPLGEFAGSVTTGVISGLNRSVSTGAGSFFGAAKQFEDVIQTDAAVNPGNSGGPLLNTSGEVIGINFATTSGADNISFALPINRAKKRIEEFRSKGKFIIPYVGIQYQMISEADARYYNNVVAGAFVARVAEDSPAAKAGVERGEIISEVEGQKVTSSFAAMIQEYEVGDTVKLRVYKEGEYREVEILLVEAP